MTPDSAHNPPIPASEPPGARPLALRIVTMPRDTNHYGTIFGGVILSYIDQAGFVEARRHAPCRWVTAAIDRVDFKAPVHLGDIVNFYAQTTRIGRTSVTVRIEVEAERNTDGTHVPVTTATLVMVAIDQSGQPVPIAQAGTAPAN
jgi:acyl-CoA thioesterase YciA